MSSTRSSAASLPNVRWKEGDVDLSSPPAAINRAAWWWVEASLRGCILRASLNTATAADFAHRQKRTGMSRRFHRRSVRNARSCSAVEMEPSLG